MHARSFVETYRLREDSPGMPCRILGGDLAAGLVYSFPEYVVYLDESQLADWGVDFQAALATALQNLRGISHEPFDGAGAGCWVSPWRDGQDAARLLLPDLLRRHPVRGDLVAMVPGCDTLLLTVRSC